LNGKCLIAVHLKNKNLVIVVTQAGRMLKQRSRQITLCILSQSMAL